MPVQTREALQTLQRFFTRRSADAPNTDAFSLVPLLTIPIDRTFDQVEPGVFTSAALAATVHKFTWSAVPDDESHVYENISFSHNSSSGLDVALAVQGRQAGTSWSRIYATWDGTIANERINLLATSSNRGGGSSSQFVSGGPLRLYSGEQLVVRLLQAPSLNAVVRVDWLRRLRQSPFTFNLNNDQVGTT